MKNILELKNVSAGYAENYSFRRDRTPVLRSINLSVEGGELLVLAGPNGSGKTTLLKVAGGFLSPCDGRVEINGTDLYRLRPRERAEFSAFLFQVRDNPWSFTVKETVAQGRFARRGWLGSETAEDRKAVDAAMEKAELGALSDRLITELSGGELQRVYIARCIAQEAAFLLLDEPENNLDPKYTYIILSLLADLVREGRGVIVSLHDLRLASRFAHRVALLSPGGIVDTVGSPPDILTEENLGRVFNLNEELVKDLIL